MKVSDGIKKDIVNGYRRKNVKSVLFLKISAALLGEHTFQVSNILLYLFNTAYQFKKSLNCTVFKVSILRTLSFVLVLAVKFALLGCCFN